VADARDLDGYPSYLWLKAGGHRLVLYKAGFQSFDENVEVNVGMVRQLKVRLERGESQPPAHAAAAPAEPPRGEGNEAPVAAAEPPSGPAGSVHLRVEPRDATVYVDDTCRGTAGDLPDLRLPAGHHRLELVRPGFRPLAQDFDVEADQAIDLHLSMERSGGWKHRGILHLLSHELTHRRALPRCNGPGQGARHQSLGLARRRLSDSPGGTETELGNRALVGGQLPLRPGRARRAPHRGRARPLLTGLFAGASRPAA
jgi:hypothetical protein